MLINPICAIISVSWKDQVTIKCRGSEWNELTNLAVGVGWKDSWNTTVLRGSSREVNWLLLWLCTTDYYHHVEAYTVRIDKL